MVRRLGEQEKALWGRVIATVEPMHIVKPKVEANNPPRNGEGDRGAGVVEGPHRTKQGVRPRAPSVTPPLRSGAPPPRVGEDLKSPNNLDGHWDRRIDKGGIVPDISVDLHGSGLSGAYARLDGALEQAIAQKFKVILLVTGKARKHDRASGEGRGAIASVVRDWLAASRHARHISAVRLAHLQVGQILFICSLTFDSQQTLTQNF